MDYLYGFHVITKVLISKSEVEEPEEIDDGRSLKDVIGDFEDERGPGTEVSGQLLGSQEMQENDFFPRVEFPEGTQPC